MNSVLGELVPCGGGDAIPLVKPRVVVGRALSCDVVVSVPTVSSQHCELELRDGVWHVRDLGSRNGVSVDGILCESKWLAPGCTLWVARERFTVVYTVEPPSGAQEAVEGWEQRLLRKDLESKLRCEQAAGGGTISGTFPSTLGELLPCGGGAPIPLVKPRLVVGRRADCDIVLSFPTISSRHCELEFKQGYWFVRDLASRNGIRVDGVACQSKWLTPKCVLTIAGPRYQIEFTPQADGPPPDDAEQPFVRSLLEKVGLLSPESPESPDDKKSGERPARQPRDRDQPRERWSLEDND